MAEQNDGSIIGLLIIVGVLFAGLLFTVLASIYGAKKMRDDYFDDMGY